MNATQRTLRPLLRTSLICLGTLSLYATAMTLLEAQFGVSTVRIWLLSLVCWLLSLAALWVWERRQKQSVTCPTGSTFHTASKGVRSSPPIARACSTQNGLSDSLYERLSATIRQYVDRLEDRDLHRRELVAHVAHDLQTPLTSVRGYLEQMIGDFHAVPESNRRRYLGDMLQSVEYLSALIGKLLQLSKLEAAELQPDFAACSLSELLEFLSYKFERSAESRRISIHWQVGSGLAPISADRLLLERAISNVVENALRYTPSGGRVSVTTAEELACIRVTVEDNGPGVAVEETERIFEPFYRASRVATYEVSRDLGNAGAERSESSSNGTGLGLAITKKIIELHQGRIICTSTPGTGLRLSILLPKSNRNVADEAAGS